MRPIFSISDRRAGKTLRVTYLYILGRQRTASGCCILGSRWFLCLGARVLGHASEQYYDSVKLLGTSRKRNARRKTSRIWIFCSFHNTRTRGCPKPKVPFTSYS